VISSAVHLHPVLFTMVPCFVGTQIPVKTLFDHLHAGSTLDEYLEQYPSVPQKLAIKLLQDSIKGFDA
jgi:uncharacterized protein (DUF433 family)